MPLSGCIFNLQEALFALEAPSVGCLTEHALLLFGLMCASMLGSRSRTAEAVSLRGWLRLFRRNNLQDLRPSAREDGICHYTSSLVLSQSSNCMPAAHVRGHPICYAPGTAIVSPKVTEAASLRLPSPFGLAGPSRPAQVPRISCIAPRPTRRRERRQAVRPARWLSTSARHLSHCRAPWSPLTGI